MKMLVALVASLILFSASARAQSSAPGGSTQSTDSGYYAAGLIDASLVLRSGTETTGTVISNLWSQSFSGEVGASVMPRLWVFLEAGRVRDTVPASMSDKVHTIALDVARLQKGLSYQVKQPVTFGQIGVRYDLARPGSQLMPYVQVAGGLAQMTRDVTFSVGASDITSQLSKYGWTLGSDLSGHVTKGLVSAGLGIRWQKFEPLVLGLDYRYGYIFDDPGLPFSRAGLLIGYRF